MKEKKYNCKHEVNLYPYTTPGDFPQNTCGHLLPCGICRLTGQVCPKHWNTNPYGGGIVYFANKVEVK